MAQKSYLQLVNEALEESKVTLDPLTSLNFASPPRTQLYNLFKGWVNRAYKELLIKRNEWFYRKERAVVTIYPRLQLRANVLGLVNEGDVLVGQSSGVRFEVLDIHAVEDVESDAVLEYTVSVEYIDSPTSADNLVLNEVFDRQSPAVAVDIGRIKGRGRYKMDDLVASVYEVDEDSFTLQPAVDFTVSPSPTDSTNLIDLMFVGPDNSGRYYTGFAAPTGRPSAIVRMPDGNYDFYPRINSPYDMGFDYTQAPVLMVTYSDTPQLLDEKYDDLLVWMTVAEYADWDERTKLFARAKKKIDKWGYLMDRDELPEVIVDIFRFDSR